MRTHRTRQVALAAVLVTLVACASFQELTPLGRFDTVVEAAVLAVAEAETQAERIVDQVERGQLDSDRARKRLDRLRSYAETVERTVAAARNDVAQGIPPETRVQRIEAVTSALRAVLLAVSEDL